MIAILIPIYNYNATPLLRELHAQATMLSIPFEVIVIEDGSQHHTKQNRETCKELKINYSALKANIGRAAIRNLLADKATYDWLIFMDCDSRIPSQNYLSSYYQAILEGKHSIVCGGRVFGDLNEISSNARLHWYCGVHKEPNANSSHRNQHFISNNFLIQKSVFEQIRFEESLKNYGHEDTLFGIKLRSANYAVHFIDNPVFHEGTETDTIYLEKTKSALSNLRTLTEEFLTYDEALQIKILRIYYGFKILKITKLLAMGYHLFGVRIEQQLKSGKPSLILFDLYKLGLLCDIMKTK